MGLISTEVDIGLSGNNTAYYESLGYEIPRRKSKWGRVTVPIGTQIKVKIQDVITNSSVKVNVKCDCCGKEYEMTYQNYNQRNRDGKIYCYKCANTILLGGKNSPRWNPDKTDEERELKRCYPEYIEFVKKVLARDDYTC